LIVFPFDQAKQVLTQYREFVESAPEELNVWALLRKAPPLPFLPADVHGKEVLVLVTFYVGDVAQGRKLIEPLLRFGTPHGNTSVLNRIGHGRKLLILCLRLVRETTGNPIIS
jgi:hypothetical protein